MWSHYVESCHAGRMLMCILVTCNTQLSPGFHLTKPLQSVACTFLVCVMTASSLPCSSCLSWQPFCRVQQADALSRWLHPLALGCTSSVKNMHAAQLLSAVWLWGKQSRPRDISATGNSALATQQQTNTAYAGTYGDCAPTTRVSRACTHRARPQN
jgi:hypothetical protein